MAKTPKIQSKILTAYAKDFSTIDVASVTTGVVTRSLTTLEDPQSIGISVDGDGIIIPPGLYNLYGIGMMYRCGHSRLYFYDVTNSIYLNTSSSLYFSASASGTTVTEAEESYKLEITESTKIELRQYTEVANAIGLSGSVSAKTNDPGTQGSLVAYIKIEKLEDR